MRLQRKILFVFIVLVLFIFLLPLILLGSFDDRLYGVFVSDPIETVNFIKSANGLSDGEVRKYKQLFGGDDGNNIFIFNRYTLVQIITPFFVENYPQDNETLAVEGYTSKKLYFTIKIEGVFNVCLLPTPFWDINEMEVIPLKFAEDGFWVRGSSHPSMITIKEKFVRMPEKDW